MRYKVTYLKSSNRSKLLNNATRSSILAVTMVLDKSLCFFRKPPNATCFIIYFNMCSQIRTLWKQCQNVQRKKHEKIIKICQFWGTEFVSLSQKYEERVRKFSLLTRRHFKVELYRYIYIVIFGKHLSELYCIVLMCFKMLKALSGRRSSNKKSWTG